MGDDLLEGIEALVRLNNALGKLAEKDRTVYWKILYCLLKLAWILLNK